MRGPDARGLASRWGEFLGALDGSGKAAGDGRAERRERRSSRSDAEFRAVDGGRLRGAGGDDPGLGLPRTHGGDLHRSDPAGRGWRASAKATSSTTFTFRWRPWQRALAASRTLESIKYSLLLGIRVPIALAIAFVIAWYLARNDIFGKRTIMYALWLAFFLPILPATLGWILLLDPNYGLVNKFVQGLIGIPVLNIYSFAGIHLAAP